MFLCLICGLFDAAYFPFSCLLSVILSPVFFFFLSLLSLSSYVVVVGFNVSSSTPLSFSACFLSNIVYFLIVPPVFPSTFLPLCFIISLLLFSLPLLLLSILNTIVFLFSVVLCFPFSSFLFIGLSLSLLLLCYIYVTAPSLCIALSTLSSLFLPHSNSLLLVLCFCHASLSILFLTLLYLLSFYFSLSLSLKLSQFILMYSLSVSISSLFIVAASFLSYCHFFNIVYSLIPHLLLACLPLSLPRPLCLVHSLYLTSFFLYFCCLFLSLLLATPSLPHSLSLSLKLYLCLLQFLFLFHSLIVSFFLISLPPLSALCILYNLIYSNVDFSLLFCHPFSFYVSLSFSLTSYLLSSLLSLSILLTPLSIIVISQCYCLPPPLSLFPSYCLLSQLFAFLLSHF
ncbi:unnamed protein product [Acanthosepion pharaonis]|uniref:Uncharacterized protein n=1 Tax=Acanthosepion pharaonis TaxID=158019 RepID=A0A812B9B8_ACAPH|nr:unnamed protein product [Sepia pharaonis]